ncbi:hypothetical protein, partial [Mycobacterium avium]|uniref:hypothetical protein n=1 Tax=Mycobacterium avium TaxID=1764 RepID=UPI000AADD334
AATERSDHAAATRYQQHHSQVSQQTERVDAAVRTTRGRLHGARAELIKTAGGLDGIVTEAQLHACRAEAVRADTDTLNAARRHARQLADAILRGGGGPAERAAATELAELHRRLVEQRPYQKALAHAHARWVHAEDTAELHRQLLTQLDAAITAATERSDHAAATRYQQHHSQVSQQTERVDAAVRTTRGRLHGARA